MKRNNTEITDDDIMEANRTYGSLGELAIMVLPQSQIIPLIRKFDLGKYHFLNMNRNVISYVSNVKLFYSLIDFLYRCTGVNRDQGRRKWQCDKWNT